MNLRIGVAVFCGISSIFGRLPVQSAEPTLRPVVEVQEEVYRYADANNGAGPMWCSGSTCVARVGDQVVASGIETLPDVPPLNNCRWLLLARRDTGWNREQADPQGRTREPSPLTVFPDGTLFLSANPTLTPSGTYSGPARPEILQWNFENLAAPPQTILPVWDGSPAFTEHSYRSFAADGPRRELILFQNIGYTHAEWSFRDAGGQWTAGKLVWPFGAEYDRPQPIRICYPDVALHNRAVYFCGVSDIQEPYEAWRSYKKELTGRDWDYDFRRLFFTWCEDIQTGKFHDWVEIASRDKTAGWIMPGDLWVAPDGGVHILWTERAIDTRLREKFFPDARQSHSLHYAVIRNGEVALRCARAGRRRESGADRQCRSVPCAPGRPIAGDLLRQWPSGKRGSRIGEPLATSLPSPGSPAAVDSCAAGPSLHSLLYRDHARRHASLTDRGSARYAGR